MSANNEEINNNSELKKIFRSFEIITEYREMLYSKGAVLREFPRVASLFTEFQFLSYYFGRVPKWRVFVRGLLSSERIVPNYVMTGPIKNGSSDLVSHLLLHPNVMPPLAKEIFSLMPANWRAYYPTVKEKQALEKEVNGPVRCGYLEPFLNNMTLMKKLHELNPNSKIVITLRDPVARAYSQWKWEIFLGGESLYKEPHFESFSKYIERALDLYPSIAMRSVCGFPLLETGMYYKAVEHWVNSFGVENVLIIDSARYFQDRQPTLEKIQEFLDLPVVDIPEYAKKANENPVKLPPPDQATKSALSEFYRPFNKKLFDYLGTSFDWQ